MNTKAECDLLLRAIRKSGSWNAHANFLIVVEEVQRNWTDFAAHIFSSFWSQFAINVLVHMPIDNTSSNARVTILSSFPMNKFRNEQFNSILAADMDSL